MSITNKIANKISRELGYDNEKSEVVAYGLFAFLQIIASLALVAIFGFIFDVLFQALVVSFASSILRQYSGGAHASKPSICLIIGTIVIILIAVIVHHVIGYIAPLYLILVGLIFVILSYYIVYKRAPIDSEAKPIKSYSKIKRMKKNSLIVLTIYFLFMLLLIVIFYLTSNKVYIEYATCIYLAFSWQAFTLTIIGHRLLNKTDTFISKTLFRRGGN